MGMKLSQLQLQAFEQVARSGSLTKAAGILNLTQSALSHRLAKLESELETSLFIRHGSGVHLTAPGAKLLKYCQLQSQLEEEVLTEIGPGASAGTELSGILRIGGTSSLVRSVVLPSISHLLRDNPKVRLELVTRELGELPSMLASGEVDILITSSKVNAPGLAEEALGHEVYVLAGRAKGTEISEVYLDHDMSDLTTTEFFRHNGQKEKLLKRSFLGDIYGIIDGVQEGLGRAVVPLHLISDTAKIKTVKGFKSLKTPVYLYRLRQPYYTRLHAAAVDALLTEVPKRLRNDI